MKMKLSLVLSVSLALIMFLSLGCSEHEKEKADAEAARLIELQMAVSLHAASQGALPENLRTRLKSSGIEIEPGFGMVFSPQAAVMSMSSDGVTVAPLKDQWCEIIAQVKGKGLDTLPKVEFKGGGFGLKRGEFFIEDGTFARVKGNIYRFSNVKWVRNEVKVSQSEVQQRVPPVISKTVAFGDFDIALVVSASRKWKAMSVQIGTLFEVGKAEPIELEAEPGSAFVDVDLTIRPKTNKIGNISDLMSADLSLIDAKGKAYDARSTSRGRKDNIVTVGAMFRVPDNAELAKLRLGSIQVDMALSLHEALSK